MPVTRGPAALSCGLKLSSLRLTRGPYSTEVGGSAPTPRASGLYGTATARCS